MTDLEISKALALAIGWKIVVLQWDWPNTKQHCAVWVDKTEGWQVFDYHDWNVIGPIAVKYNCFPTRGLWGDWYASLEGCAGNVIKDTPQKAIALAVIGAKK